MSENDFIRVINCVTGIRTRPAMYVGDTAACGLHHLAFAIIDDATAEIASGFATHLAVTLHVDGSIEIADEERPIPVRRIPEFDNRSVLEFVFTDIAAGSSASPRGSRLWETQCFGMHGICCVTVNALSEWLTVEVGDGETLVAARQDRCPSGVLEDHWHGSQRAAVHTS